MHIPGTLSIHFSFIVNTFIKRKLKVLEYKILEGQLTIKFSSKPTNFLSVVHSALPYILKVTPFHYFTEYGIDFTKLVSAMQFFPFFVSDIFSNVQVIK